MTNSYSDPPLHIQIFYWLILFTIASVYYLCGSIFGFAEFTQKLFGGIGVAAFVLLAFGF